DQADAAILIADPQVYARATLINDRRRESDYLQKLLENSESVTFTPQLVRDLRTIDALAISLGARFGETQAESESDQLNRQIEIRRLQAELAVLEKLLEAIQDAEAPEVQIPAPDWLGSTVGGEPSARVVYPDLA